MISSLEYLDYDVSNILSEYIRARKNYNNAIKGLNELIEVNRCAKYLKNFNCFRDREYDDKQRRLILAFNLLNQKKKPYFIENFPTKVPNYYRLKRRDKIKIIDSENYIIEGLGWRLKIFPPRKNRYQSENLSLIRKDKKNKYFHIQ